MRTDHSDIEEGMARPGRKWGYLAVLAVILVGTLGAVGWHWRSGVRLTSVEISSACETEWRLFSSSTCPALNSTRQEIAELLGVETGALLYEMDPAEIVRRAERHPWVKEARMERTPGGRLILTLTERAPVLLAMVNGRPAHYIDAEGFRMPFVSGVAYDVPLLHDLEEAFDAERPVAEPAVLELAAVLDDLDPSIQALISEIELGRSPGFVFHTTVLDSRGSIEVTMGAENIREQLIKLHAFWHQALLPESGRSVRKIDLRFDSQIVTR